MKPRITLAIVCCVTAAIAIVALPAEAVQLTRHDHYRNPETHLKEVVTWTVDVAPPDSDDDGFANADDDCPHDGYTGNGGCTPPPPPAPVETTTTTTYATSGSCPSYMSGEAASPDAVNPVSGATGCFQILPSTHDALGCTDYGVACAQLVCAAQGDDAWVAADPCGSLAATEP